MILNYADHYWRVLSNPDQVYSTRRATYVALDDEEYRNWTQARAAEWTSEFSSHGLGVPESMSVRADSVGLASDISTEDEMVAILLANYPQSSPIKAWSPDTIIAAVVAMAGEEVASALLDNANAVQRALFQRARFVREDDPRLIAALAGGGVTIDNLKAAIAAL